VLKPKIERILHYLECAEAREPDVWLRDDYRIAWLTILYAARGRPQPFVLATYQVLGIHPDRLLAAIEARRRVVLGSLYKPQVISAVSPKKPSTSVSLRKLSADRQSKVSGE
jgi:hypothetical protein